MYAEEPFTGVGSLADKTLCLTYDDGPGATSGAGPGPRTLEVAHYLHTERIQATFFMVGRHIREFPEAPADLSQLGHLVGNHTDSHRSLPEVLLTGGRRGVVDEIAVTDELLRPSVTGPIYVRAPYGDWSASLAVALNSEPRVSAGHVGPIHWDIDGRDWEHWEHALTPEACARAYLSEIEAAGRGIVLLHDCSADPDGRGERLKSLNRTLELTQILVPELKRRGWKFLRIDEIPGLGAHGGSSPRFTG